MFRHFLQHSSHSATSALVLAVFIVSVHASSEESDVTMKEKRAGVLRLFPFPRVGRLDPDMRPQGPTADATDELTDTQAQYLHGVAEFLLGGGSGIGGPAIAGDSAGPAALIDDEFDGDLLRSAFEQPPLRSFHQHFVRPVRAGPGRRDWNASPSRSDMKRANGPVGANGMWFGPRLGRVQKRSAAPGAPANSGDHQRTADQLLQ